MGMRHDDHEAAVLLQQLGRCGKLSGLIRRVLQRADENRQSEAAEIDWRRRGIADLEGHLRVGANGGRVFSGPRNHFRRQVEPDPALDMVCEIDQLMPRPATEIENARRPLLGT